MICLFDTPTQKLLPIRPHPKISVPINVASTSTIPDGTRPDITIYVCGITPYDSAHLGHIFTFLAYDLLQRRLEDTGYSVRLVRNITDVDEPIFKKAAEQGEDYKELAARETEHFQTVMTAMHFKQPFAEPRASQYISQMADAVAQLLKDGYAYRLEQDVYFDISKLSEMPSKFGSFSKFSERLQLAFMTARGGDPERFGKHQPLDFLLWRGIDDPNDTAAWASPVGRGRPGWHIECTVMSNETLHSRTLPLTIHGGGMDLIFPHHECEIAQHTALASRQNSDSAITPLAHHWMHVAPLLYQGEKMSKSLGNLVFAHDLLKHHSPGVVRLAMMQLHYRTGGEWRHDALDLAERAHQLLGQALNHPYQLGGDAYLDQVRCALDDDLDTHTVLHILRDISEATLANAKINISSVSNNIPLSNKPSLSQLQKIVLLLGLATQNKTTDLVTLI